MKSTSLSSFVALALALGAHAYLDVEDGAFNVRHIHMVERGVDGEIVGRAFGNTYDIVRRDVDELEARGRCTTVMACGTAAGCATMAGQRYCKGESWEKSFQKAVSQTGANGITGLKMMAEGMARGPAGMIAGMAKSTAKAIIDAKKETKATKAAAAKKGESKKGDKGKKEKGTSKPKKGSPKKGAEKKKANGKGGSKKAAPKKGASNNKKGPSKKPSSQKGANAKGGSKKPAPKKPAPAKGKRTTPKSKAPAPKPKAASPKPKASAPKAKAPAKKTKRDLQDEDIIDVVNKRDFEVVERDEDMNFIQRSEYSIFGIVTRDEAGSITSRECEMYNGDMSCM